MTEKTLVPLHCCQIRLRSGLSLLTRLFPHPCHKEASVVMHEPRGFHGMQRRDKTKAPHKEKENQQRDGEEGKVERCSNKQGDGKKHHWEKSFDKSLLHCASLDFRNPSCSDCLKWLQIVRLCFPSLFPEQTKQTGACFSRTAKLWEVRHLLWFPVWDDYKPHSKISSSLHIVISFAISLHTLR